VADRLIVASIGLVGLSGAAASMLAPCSPTLRCMALLLLGSAGLTLLGIGCFGSRESVTGCVRAAREELFLER